jgi:hypothetical protein
MMSQMKSKKARLMMSAGMFSLAAGLIILNFVHPATPLGKNWHDGISGFFVGISIALNLGAVLLAKRQSNCVSM